MGEKAKLDEGPGLFPGLPIRAVRCDPMGVSADCKQVCRCNDGSDYAIKSANDIPSMPHNEWFCAKLADIVGLATPAGKVVEVDGGTSFGSRWQSGEESSWWVSAKSGKLNFDDLAPALSRIFAFDLFVHNGDRHLNNYFVHQQKMGPAVLAMDFGRAWLFNGFPLPALPMNKSEKTIGDFKKLIVLFGNFLKIDEVKEIATSLRAVKTSQVLEIIVQHPKEWLSEAEKSAIEDWWSSDGRTARIDQVEEGISDGSFL